MRREQGAQAGASSRKAESVKALSARRSELYTLLSSVTPGEGAARDEFERRVRLAGRARHGLVVSLDAMGEVASERLARAEKQPALARYYADKSFTAERVVALTAPAAEALRSRTAHAAARAKVNQASAVVDGVGGRLRDELMRLRFAVEAQRAKGVALPEVELRAIRGVGVTRSVAEVAPPVATATPGAPTG